MRVPERDLLRAVPNSLSDLKGAETAVDEKRYMRVAKVMHPDLFHPCLFASGLHRRIKAVFGQGEDAVILLDVIELFQTVLHLLAQKLWNLDCPVTVFRLCGLDHIPLPDPLEVLVNSEDLLLKVEIRGCQGQQFSLPDTAPVQHLEGIVEDRSVHHHLRESQVLLLRPKEHLPAAQQTGHTARNHPLERH